MTFADMERARRMREEIRRLYNQAYDLQSGKLFFRAFNRKHNTPQPKHVILRWVESLSRYGTTLTRYHGNGLLAEAFRRGAADGKRGRYNVDAIITLQKRAGG